MALYLKPRLTSHHYSYLSRWSMKVRRSLHRSTKRNQKTSQKTHHKNPIEWYAQKLESHPLLTKALTSAFISGSGDLTCQYLVHKRQHQQRQNQQDGIDGGFIPDWKRTGRFSFLGLALIAPIIHHWYKFLNTFIPGNSLRVVLQRTFCDQILFAPLFIPTFMTSLMVLEHKEEHRNLDGITYTLKKNLPDVVMTNWMVWIPAIFLNFRYVPPQWQVLYSNCVGFVWNVYLSWKTQEDQ